MAPYRLPLVFLAVALTSGAVVIARHQKTGPLNLGLQPAPAVDAKPRDVAPPPLVTPEKKVEDPPKLQPAIAAKETSQPPIKVSYLDRFSSPGSGSAVSSVASGSNEVTKGEGTVAPTGSASIIQPPGATKTIAQLPGPTETEAGKKGDTAGNWRGLAVVIPVTSNLPNEGLADSPPGKVISALLKQHPGGVKAWWMGADGVLTPVAAEVGADAAVRKEMPPVDPFPAGSPLQNLLEVASSRLEGQGHIVDGQGVEGMLLWPGFQPPTPPRPADKLHAKAGWSMVWMSAAASPQPALDAYFGRKPDDTTERFFPMNDSPAGIALLLGQLIPGGGSTTP